MYDIPTATELGSVGNFLRMRGPEGACTPEPWPLERGEGARDEREGKKRQMEEINYHSSFPATPAKGR